MYHEKLRIVPIYADFLVDSGPKYYVDNLAQKGKKCY